MRRRAWMAVAALICAGCTSSGAGGPSAFPPQTLAPWTTTYNHVTCEQWLTAPAGQRTIAARNLLAALHAYDQFQPAVARFIRSIDTICRPSPSMSLADAAASLAIADTTDFP